MLGELLIAVAITSNLLPPFKCRLEIAIIQDKTFFEILSFYSAIIFILCSILCRTCTEIISKDMFCTSAAVSYH